MTVRDYSTTPGSNNAAPPNGWPEGQAASTANDCGRQMMAEIRETFEDLPYFDWGDDPTRVDNDTFTVATDLTARYPVGARVKLVGATTGTARISASSHAAGTTTIDVVMDSGNVPTSLTRVAVQPSSGSSATPASVTLSASAGTGFALSRSDHVHALDQSIAPSMTATWTFTKVGGTPTASAIYINSAAPSIGMRESGAAADNRLWDQLAFGEALLFRAVNDAENSTGTWMQVDRTGATIDRVTFPATSGGTSPFYVGQTAVGTLGSTVAAIHTNAASNRALSLSSPTAATHTLVISNQATAGDNAFIGFYTEGLLNTLRGSITYNRGGGVVAYNTTCREALKQNIRACTAALPLLSQIQVVEFDWRDSGAHLPYFVTYERMEPIAPWACQNDGVDVSKLVPLTIAAVQELLGQVSALRERVAALEGGIIEVKPR